MNGMGSEKEEARRRAIAKHIESGREHLERSKAGREATRRALDAARREIDRLKLGHAR